MSFKEFLKILASLGLRRSDAKIYFYLAKKGPLKAREICAEMNLRKQQVYPCLKNLQSRGIVKATIEHPSMFYAMPFESVLTMLADMKINEAKEADKYKTNIHAIWQEKEMTDTESRG